MSSADSSGRLSQRAEAASDAFASLTSAIAEITATDAVVYGSGSTPANVEALIASESAVRAYATGFPSRLGPRAAAAWRSWRLDPATRDWERTVAETLGYALAGRQTPLSSNPVAAGTAFVSAPPWLNGLTAVIQGASTDMRDIAQQDELAAVRSTQVDAAVFALSLLVAAAAAILLTRAVVRPLRHLATWARKVAEGEFTLPPVPPGGPREVADTILAVDDMSAVLAAVESFTVTLADDPAAAALDVPLPGRTGTALQATLDRLRESVLLAEQQRIVLHDIATHDSLTGLLNREAAHAAVGRDLSRAAREHSTVMALFVDMDGLKTINDTHGHQAGDDAIRLTADALRTAARSSDVVGRLGGDEFLVAGVAAHTGAEIHALAERFRRAVSATRLLADGVLVPLTASIGIGLSEPDDDIESLVRKADQALYKAKLLGRDRICWLGETEPIAASR